MMGVLIATHRAKAASIKPKRLAPETATLTLAAALVALLAPVEVPEAELPVLVGPLEEEAGVGY